MRNPKHPYTFTLLNAVPKDKDSRIDLSKVIPPNDSHVIYDSCVYYSRCLKKTDSCKRNQELVNIEGTHFVKCERADGGADDDE